ncbi:MAG: FAD-dependent monooxygenase [Betaproteobacteria bacterium]|nr:FAD-dependent monooxygenase [Betaproteobacteria bacterium]
MRARRDSPWDVVVVGAGITGVALGLALHQAGLRVRVLDRAAAPPFVPDPAFDPRIYAISTASQAFLARVGGWQAMDPARIEPIRAMDIQGDGQGRLHFDAAGPDGSLGYIAESGALLDGLLTVVRRSAPDLIEAPVSVQLETEEGGDAAQRRDHLTLHCTASPAAPATTYRTRLLVAADGLQSSLRQQLGIAARFRPYGQTAVVANYESDVAHGGAARQWFLHGEVVALLPLPGNLVSLVWSAREEHAQALLALTPQERTAALQAVVGYGVGNLVERSKPAGFPLRWMRVERLTAPRAVLVGDAAHGVHPMAGQGLNLGLQDAAELSALLVNRGEGPDCGDAGLLRRYARARAEPVWAMQGLTDGLFRLFGEDRWGLPRVRNWGMSQVDRLPALKRLLIDQANS